MRAGAVLALLLLATAPGILGAKPDEGPRRPEGLGDVRDVRSWSHPDYTRVVVELSRGVETVVKRLPADPRSGRPDRLYIDLKGIWVGRDYSERIEIGDGLLAGVRLGQNTLRTARVVLDLARYDRHRLLTLRSPHRVVLDVYGRRDHPETLEWGGKRENAGPDSRLPMALRPVRTVVIDPGHGGRDPGAIGIGGLVEKTVNLRIARKLAEDLEAEGFNVVLTRNDDRYLDLEERTVLAEAARGDLFVSIHANSSPNRRTRGIEIYYLDQNHERHALDVAARENGVPRSEVNSLQRALAKLRVSEASVHSSRLATLVHDSVVPAVKKRYRGMADLGVKKAPFYVLFLSSMPSILVETGFVTNRRDARLLRSSKYVDLLSARIASGLAGYRETAPTVVARRVE